MNQVFNINSGGPAEQYAASYRPQTIVLRNGMRVIWDHRPSFQSVAMCCVIDAGSQNDPPQKHGLAHLVEHLLFRAVCHNGQNAVFSEILDAGGMINAITFTDSTQIHLNTYHGDALEGLRGLSQILMGVEHNQDVLAKEKTIIQEELLLTGEDHKNAHQRVILGLMGAEESQRHLAGGTVKMLKRIEMDDVLAFHRQYYRGQNITLVIVGNFELERHIEEIESIFATIPAGRANLHESWPIQAGPKSRFLTVQNIRDCEVSFVFCYHPVQAHEIIVLEMLSDMFGASPNSRLFRRLREREALTYDIDCGLHMTRDYATIDVVCVSSYKKVLPVTRGILEEANHMKSDLGANENIDVIRDQYIKRYLMAFQYPEFACDWYAHRQFSSPPGCPLDLQSWVEQTRTVTVDDLRRTAGRLFNREQLYGYLVGPFSFWKKRRVQKLMKQMG